MSAYAFATIWMKAAELMLGDVMKPWWWVWCEDVSPKGRD